MTSDAHQRLPKAISPRYHTSLSLHFENNSPQSQLIGRSCRCGVHTVDVVIPNTVLEYMGLPDQTRLNHYPFNIQRSNPYKILHGCYAVYQRVSLHHLRSSTSFATGWGMKVSSCTKTRTSFSTTFSRRSLLFIAPTTPVQNPNSDCCHASFRLDNPYWKISVDHSPAHLLCIAARTQSKISFPFPVAYSKAVQQYPTPAMNVLCNEPNRIVGTQQERPYAYGP